jgi:hypothetical protein
MNSERTAVHYRAYLLRLWQERAATPACPAVWRFSLEEVGAGQRRGFSALAELMAFLQAQMEGGEAQAMQRDA